MRVEVIDKNSGAILFKQDEESRTVEDLKGKVAKLEELVSMLQEKLESQVQEESETPQG